MLAREDGQEQSWCCYPLLPAVATGLQQYIVYVGVLCDHRRQQESCSSATCSLVCFVHDDWPPQVGHECSCSCFVYVLCSSYIMRQVVSAFLRSRHVQHTSQLSRMSTCTALCIQPAGTRTRLVQSSKKLCSVCQSITECCDALVLSVLHTADTARSRICCIHAPCSLSSLALKRRHVIGLIKVVFKFQVIVECS